MGAGVMPWADVATNKAKPATAINLSIALSFDRSFNGRIVHRDDGVDLTWIKVHCALRPKDEQRERRPIKPDRDTRIVVRSVADCRNSPAMRDGEYPMYVLIVVSRLGGAVQGATISMQEFSTVERCEAVRQTLMEYAKARSIEETFRPVCMPK
jgi:hypothetical protein